MAVLGEYRERRAMLAGAEVKMGQAHSRARRRVEESEGLAREVAVESNPGSAGAATIEGMVSAPILVDDEDDDVVVSSPRSFAQAIFKARVAVEEDPLELRLGPVGGGTSEYNLRASFTQQPRQGRRGRPARSTIDLSTTSRSDPLNDDCVILHEYSKSRKRKSPAALEPSFMTPITPPAPEAEIYKLNCAICMDVMKDETSTICGHIFCQKCIHGAINSQKKCPTCRKKLTLKNTHRIYL